MTPLLPWLVYLIAARTGGVGWLWASILGLCCSAGVFVVRSRRRGVSHVFEFASFVAFTVLAVVAVTMGRKWPDVDGYGRAIGAGVLALGAFASVKLRPLSIDYTRDRVPANVADSEIFSRVNRRITLVAAAGTAATALSFVLGGLIRGHVGSTIFNWLLPMAIAFATVHWCSVEWTAVDEAEESAETVLLADVGRRPLRSIRGGRVVDDRPGTLPRLRSVKAHSGH